MYRILLHFFYNYRVCFLRCWTCILLTRKETLNGFLLWMLLILLRFTSTISINMFGQIILISFLLESYLRIGPRLYNEVSIKLVGLITDSTFLRIVIVIIYWRLNGMYWRPNTIFWRSDTIYWRPNTIYWSSNIIYWRLNIIYWRLHIIDRRLHIIDRRSNIINMVIY